MATERAQQRQQVVGSRDRTSTKSETPVSNGRYLREDPMLPKRPLLLTITAALVFTAEPSSLRSATHSQAAAVRLTFTPEADSFASATRAYQELWSTEGARILRAMQDVAGLRFRDSVIHVVIYEGVSWSGYRGTPMKLRASYPPDTKKATLVHELGHRLMTDMYRQSEEEHPALFLWLYDVWVALYGEEFAKREVEVEKRRRGPYPKAWDDALALTAAERAARWRAIVAERRPASR
jgi:hypothetical protein